ncbi:MAG: DUF1080 domain-containing protein [Candidatus Omnitrophica bacterium]|nr:DUF1080 domain-containing protein [Candidatus Omnitrophota bacterium]
MKSIKPVWLPLLMGLCFLATAGLAEDLEWKPLFKDNSIEGMEITNQGAWRFFQTILNGQPDGGEGSTLLIGPEIPGDFALRLEFKVLGNRQAAVHFRTHYLDEKLYGYKVELPPYRPPLNGEKTPWAPGDLSVVGSETEKLATASEIEVTNPTQVFRSWTPLELRAVGDRITISVNGKETIQFKDDRFLAGRIALESSGQGGAGLVMFQNVEYADLADESDYTSLFNGENLDGWKIHGLDKQWWVEDGVIHSESVDDAYSYLATNDQLKSFSIKAEFLGLAGGNSGLFFHSHLDGTKISGIQAEVQPPNEKRLGHSGNLYDSSGRGWLIDPDSLAPEKEAVFRLGEWNSIRVDVKDHHIKTWLNGMRIVDYMDKEPAHDTGVIALQIHSGGGVKVDWRNLRIKKL